MALTLSKTGIAQDQTINAWHVTQSVDALTGTAAYNITLSGSLTLTGSVDSFNGYTGSLFGTASYASQALTASYVENVDKIEITDNPSYGGETFYPTFTSNTSGYGSVLVDSSQFTYNPSTDTLTAGNLEGTASLATSASFAETYTDPTFVDGAIYPSGSVSVPDSPLKMIAGAGKSGAASTGSITINELIGKTLNQNCFVVATVEDNAGSSISIDPSGIPPNLKFVTTSPNVDFHFQIFYV